jgi:signal transduction histidine kinase
MKVLSSLIATAIALPAVAALAQQATARRANGHAIVRIIDSGGGIPEEQPARLGQPFRSTKPHGTVWVFRSRVASRRAHGGELRVESVQDEGTTAIVRLPLAIDRSAATRDLQETR